MLVDNAHTSKPQTGRVIYFNDEGWRLRQRVNKRSGGSMTMTTIIEKKKEPLASLRAEDDRGDTMISNVLALLLDRDCTKYARFFSTQT